MFFMLINAIVSAIFFVLVVVPPLFIYDPSKHPHESLGPPTAGEVFSGDDVTHSVKQKLYMLFVVPACAVVNVFFLYFTYYRPVRGVQYRLEMNVLALHEQRQMAWQRLRAVGFTGGSTNYAPSIGNRSFLAPERVTVLSTRSTAMLRTGTSISPGGGAPPGEPSTEESRLKTDFRRRARPKTVSRDAFIHSTFYPEVKRLMRTVENSFLTPAAATRQNFDMAVAKLTGEVAPGVAPGRMFGSDAPLGFYSSKRDKNGSPTGDVAATSDDTCHEPIAGKVPALNRRRSSPHGEEMDFQAPLRSTSVVLVLSDKGAGRRSSQSAGGGRGGSGSGRRRSSTQAHASSLNVANDDSPEHSSGMSSPSPERTRADNPQKHGKEEDRYHSASDEEGDAAAAQADADVDVVAAGRKGSSGSNHNPAQLLGRFWHRGGDKD